MPALRDSQHSPALYSISIQVKMRLISAAFDGFQGIGSFCRYLVTGGVLFAIDLMVFLVLVKLGGLEPALAQPIGRGIGAIAGFFGHRHVTFFQSRDNPRHGIATQTGGYLIVGVAMLLITPFILIFFLFITGGKLIVAKVLTEIVAVIAVYLSLRFVFGARGT